MPEAETAARPATDATAAETTDSYPQYSTIFDQQPLTLTATPALEECARIIAAGRQRGKHLAAASTSIGTAEADDEACYFGTLAELLLYDCLEKRKLHPQYILIASRAVTEADFRLDGLRYEVKCSPPGKAFLSISQRQHLDPRRPCDFYVCCLFETPNTLRVCRPIPHAEVSRWTPMNNGHEPYFSIHRADLQNLDTEPSLSAQDAALRFLHALFAPYTDTEALRLEVRCLAPQWDEKRVKPWPRRWFRLEAASGAVAACLRYAGAWETYVGVLPRVGEAGTQEAVSVASWLWCDVDGGIEGVEGSLRRLQAADVPEPPMIVVSGNGVHAYWRLAEPITLPDRDARYRFKQVLQRLCKAIGGEAPAAHADPSRADTASILRVPGTFNRKQQDAPRPVTLHHFAPETEARSLTWWRAHLPALPAPKSKPATTFTDPLHSGEGLLRWARTPYPEGHRHRDLAGAAAWLVRDVGLSKPLAQELLTLKAQVSPGNRPITPEEVEAIIRWA